MNGRSRLLLDTNAVIAYFAGQRDVVEAVDAAEWVGISVVSYLEFLAFPALSESDAVRFQEFCVQVAVVGLQFEDRQLCQEVTRLRREHRLRLPDAIIAAAALVRGALLVTADGHFDRVAELQQLRFV